MPKSPRVTKGRGKRPQKFDRRSRKAAQAVFPEVKMHDLVFAKELGLGMAEAVEKADTRNARTGRPTAAVVTATYGSSPHFHQLAESGLMRWAFVEGRLRVKGAKNYSPHSALVVAFT